ncbi:MAG: proton-conducting transporter membrane subunit, partial [Chitinivibrionales bacterium]|nr:proton-conducting transporter membrane subunit [Chitinivibrionales bacterium]
MKDYHEHHKDLKDKRPFFFFILFVFLSAMFGLVFSNNLMWLYFFWEITTLCSFLLIGYQGNAESINNAFKALIYNLLGGLGFAGGVIYLYYTSHTIELDKMLTLEKAAVLLPAVLISFAGITKSAQMPFSSWLLGAMVAPTPVSALLHSSTMVKAGVYIIVRLAPLFTGTHAGLMVALVGGSTFLITSLIAISQRNAKRVLAYSTVANLGLIIMCAGVGTPAAIWAAIMLIIFHAISKCLLFLCVGSVEHKIGSRDIEDMDGLIAGMPQIAAMMLIGMAGMFLAPFGMLISKWVVLKALVEVQPLLAGIVVFGSAATLFFWGKWMGKLISVMASPSGLEKKVSKDEFVSLYILAC